MKYQNCEAIRVLGGNTNWEDFCWPQDVRELDQEVLEIWNVDMEVSGRLSGFCCGGGGKISTLVRWISWLGFLASLSLLLAGSVILLFKFLGHADGIVEMTVVSPIEKKLKKLDNWNWKTLNSTKIIEYVRREKDSLFYGASGIFLVLALLSGTYFISLRESEKVRTLIRIACYLSAISRIVLSPRYAILIIFDLDSSSDYGKWFLIGIKFMLLDIIFPSMVLCKMNKEKIIKAFLYYIISVFVLRLIIYIILSLEPQGSFYIFPIITHIISFALSFSFFVVQHSFLLDDKKKKKDQRTNKANISSAVNISTPTPSCDNKGFIPKMTSVERLRPPPPVPHQCKSVPMTGQDSAKPKKGKRTTAGDDFEMLKIEEKFQGCPDCHDKKMKS